MCFIKIILEIIIIVEEIFILWIYYFKFNNVLWGVGGWFFVRFLIGREMISVRLKKNFRLV